MDGPDVALTIVAAYDVSEDSRRSRLAAVLQAHGDRVQKSVFVLTLTPESLTEIRVKAHELLDHDTDSLYLFRQCSTCWETLECIGQAHTPEKVLFWAVL